MQHWTPSLPMSKKKCWIHKQGKGFLGFEKIKTTDAVKGIVYENTMGYNSVYYNTYPVGQTVKTTTDSIISTTFLTNNVTPLAGKRIFPYVSSQTTTDNLTGLSETKTISNFDAYGNPRSIQTTKGGLTETQTITYTQKGAWCPNKVQSITTVSTYAGQSETKQVNYDYDNKGNLTKEIINPNSGEYKVTTEYKDFNAFGQAQTIEVKAKDADGIERTRGSSMTYTDTGTSKGRFVTSKTNVLGETTTYDWDETRGLLNSETTHGKTTYYTYDSFGKLKETKYPDGNRKTQVWRWVGSSPSGDLGGCMYYSYTQTSGNAPVTTWFDALGREIQRDTYGLNNRKISVSTEYYTYGANKGRLYRVSEPYFAGDAKIWAETYSTYDPYGRSTTVQTPMGDIHTSYNGLSTTVTTPEDTTTTTLNNAGLVESNTINGKTVSYTYYPSGLTKTATPQGGQTLSMEYDLQGNRTKLTDPDAGVVQTRYNGFGELVEEKQMIHQSGTWITTTNHYAPTTGLLQSISRNGETTSYTYDASSEYPGRIQSVEISGQHKQTFTYDDLSRVINVKEEIDSKVFNQSTQYDALGRIRKETYPSGYFTVNHYDDHCGMLAEVKDKYNRRLWKVNSENAKGQIIQVQQGDKTTTLGYDNRGMPTSIQASGVVNMTYFFNNNGNLNHRIDSLTNQKEVFQYDGMNRLTHWNIYRNNALVKSDSMVYHTAKGTITSKSDLGNLTMTYGENGKPHALTSISGVPTGFPASDLNVTYTDFKKIKTLSEGNQQYTLTYGIDDQRRKSIYKENGTTKETRYYIGNYEEKINHITGITEKIHYLSGGAIYILSSPPPLGGAGGGCLLYLYRLPGFIDCTDE